MSELVYILPFLIGLTLLVLVVAGDDRVPAAPFSHDAAEYLARAMRTRSVFIIAATGALVAYGLVNQDLIDMMKFSSWLFVLALVPAIRRWLDASRALRMLQRGGAAAERFGDLVLVTNGDEHQKLPANAWLIARAEKHAIPRATL